MGWDSTLRAELSKLLLALVGFLGTYSVLAICGDHRLAWRYLFVPHHFRCFAVYLQHSGTNPVLKAVNLHQVIIYR